MTILEHKVLGDFLLMTVIAFFGLALPGYALFRRFWPESDWNLAGSISTSKIILLDLVVAGGFVLLFALNWKVAAPQGAEGVAKEASASIVLHEALGFITIAAVIPAVLFWRVNLVEFFGLRWDKWRNAVWILPTFVIVMIALGAVLMLTGWSEWVEAHFGAREQRMVELLKTTSDKALIGAIAFAAIVVAPIVEEVIFRGYLYPIVKRYSERWFAALFTGLLFGVIHFNMMGLPLLAIMGVVLALLYEKTGSLWVAIGCHAAFNATSVCVMLFSRLHELPTAP